MTIDFKWSANGVGPLRAKMRRAEVRSILGEYEEFKKSIFSENTTDNFPGENLHVYYSVDNAVKGIEFFKGARLFYAGIDLVEAGFEEVQAVLVASGIPHDIDVDGINISGGNIRIYAPKGSGERQREIYSVYVDL